MISPRGRESDKSTNGRHGVEGMLSYEPCLYCECFRLRLHVGLRFCSLDTDTVDLCMVVTAGTCEVQAVHD
jgi:hypothetical protein